MWQNRAEHRRAEEAKSWLRLVCTGHLPVGCSFSCCRSCKRGHRGSGTVAFLRAPAFVDFTYFSVKASLCCCQPIFLFLLLGLLAPMTSPSFLLIFALNAQFICVKLACVCVCASVYVCLCLHKESTLARPLRGNAACVCLPWKLFSL